MKGTLHVKMTSLFPSAAAVVLIVAAVLAATSAVQARQNEPQLAAAQANRPIAQETPPPGASAPQQGSPHGAGRPVREFPAPTNLQVLPKNTTGRQVRDIMQTWAGSLGVRCGFCHAVDSKNIGPKGQPRLNYADDAKDDKKIARLMYTMTQHINEDYISRTTEIDTDAMGMTVTCGTCHRGHDMPQEFAIPKEGRQGEPGE